MNHAPETRSKWAEKSLNAHIEIIHWNFRCNKRKLHLNQFVIFKPGNGISSKKSLF